MSDHKCEHFCYEYGCEQSKQKPVNERTREQALNWSAQKSDFSSSLIAATSLSAGVHDKKTLPRAHCCDQFCDEYGCKESDK